MTATETMSRRGTIILNTHPFFHFTNAGFYYCWELGATYDIILLVEAGRESDPAIRLLLAEGRISRVVTMPSVRDALAIHRWACRDMARLIATVRPVAVMQQNYHFHYSKYLFGHARRLVPSCLCIVFLGANLHLDLGLEHVLREVMNMSIAARARRLPMLPLAFVRRLSHWYGRYLLMRDFTLLPLLLTGQRLPPTIDEHGARILSRHAGDLVDHFLCYQPHERDSYRMQNDDPSLIQLIAHPFTTAVEARALLYPGSVIGNDIVVLSSRCFDFDRYRADSVATEVDGIVALWRRYLDAIRARLGGGTICWKLHPNFGDNPVMVAITRRLAAEMVDFRVIPPEFPADRLMITAKAVVGDTSTTLIWASRLGDRPVISLDVFGVPGGGAMARNPGIQVIRSLDEIAELATCRPQASPAAYPTAASFFAAALAARWGVSGVSTSDFLPLLSIVTATRNAARFLPDLIASIRADKPDEVEWIVIDGASTDGTTALIAAAGDVVDHLVSAPDRGVYDAWNKALRLARAPWIMFVGADDIFTPGALRRALAAARAAAANINLITACNQWVDRETLTPLRRLDAPWDLTAMRRRMAFSQAGAMHHRSLFARYGEFDASLRVSGDYDFLMRAGPEIRSTTIPAPPLLFVRSGGISDTIPALYEMRLVRARHIPSPALLWRLQFAVHAFRFLVRGWLPKSFVAFIDHALFKREI